jgi:hypothetical protein
MMPLEAAARVEIAVHSGPDLAEGNDEPRSIEAVELLGANVREVQGE